ncbi:hypothetical protein BMT55_00045 [Listeria newyorkensis]|uniref:DUF6906 domain-containing protein n=2 Tax=Listeria TaxID=1637 RepID=A0ABX4XQJ0_9LIST|nr:hypothetical protein [Listeria newyorkensis]PNP94783.1 hypothetical protein BMT55_00045 [Listeria newyorkensis]
MVPENIDAQSAATRQQHEKHTIRLIAAFVVGTTSSEQSIKIGNKKRRMQLMKSGKKPNKKQSIFIKENGINPDNWFIYKNTSEEMHLVHRYLDKRTRKIIK